MVLKVTNKISKDEKFIDLTKYSVYEISRIIANYTNSVNNVFKVTVEVPKSPYLVVNYKLVML